MKFGKPDDRSLNKEADCGIGGGVKWDANDLFYEEDSKFPEDFIRTAPLGKYFIENNDVIEDLTWREDEEEEWR